MRLLGIDYGRAKIGLSRAETFLAEPWLVIANNEHLLTRLDSLCRQEEIQLIILGLPEGPLVKEIQLFAGKLTRQTGLKVIFEPETLTTQDAIGKMIAAGKKRKFRRQKEDACAAALILQNYLDNHV